MFSYEINAKWISYKEMSCIVRAFIESSFPRHFFSPGWLDILYIIYMAIQIYRVVVVPFVTAVGRFSKSGMNLHWFRSILGALFLFCLFPSS